MRVTGYVANRGCQISRFDVRLVLRVPSFHLPVFSYPIRPATGGVALCQGHLHGSIAVQFGSQGEPEGSQGVSGAGGP